MPGYDGVGLDDDEGRAPFTPYLGQTDPQQAIRVVQFQALLGRALKDSDLMAKRNVFQLQSSAAFHYDESTLAKTESHRSVDRGVRNSLTGAWFSPCPRRFLEDF